MKLVALTGGIASGKSAACRRFEQLGIRVTDADVIAASVLQDSKVLGELVNHFGNTAIDEHGQYNRPAMRQRVFSDPSALAQLNAIVHPRVRSATQQALAQPHSAAYQIWAIPLLIETHQTDIPDRIVVLDIDPETQISRLMQRDGVDRAGAMAAIANQTDPQRRLAVADYVLDNRQD